MYILRNYYNDEILGIYKTKNEMDEGIREMWLISWNIDECDDFGRSFKEWKHNLCYEMY